jgi:hypothetical protein
MMIDDDGLYEEKILTFFLPSRSFLARARKKPQINFSACFEGENQCP